MLLRSRDNRKARHLSALLLEMNMDCGVFRNRAKLPSGESDAIWLSRVSQSHGKISVHFHDPPPIIPPVEAEQLISYDFQPISRSLKDALANSFRAWVTTSVWFKVCLFLLPSFGLRMKHHRIVPLHNVLPDLQRLTEPTIIA